MRQLQNKAPVSGRSRRSYSQATEPQANFGCIQPARVAAVAIDHGFGSPDDIGNLGAIFSLNGEFHDRLAVRQQVSESSCYLALEPAMPRMGWRHHDLIKPIELNFEREITKARISANIFPSQFLAQQHAEKLLQRCNKSRIHPTVFGLS